MGRLFGTDGVRGIANKELTADLAFELGRAGAIVLTNELSYKPKILVGKDTRLSGDMLECALMAGICSTGAQVVELGVIATPAVAYLIRKYGADAGVVISASHNSFEYNGIKFFNSQGYKLRDEVEEKIEELILDKNNLAFDLPIGKEVGHRTYAREAADDYINYSIGAIGCSLSGLKVLIDCSNGANSKIAPLAFEKLGASVECISDEPDGININDKCGSTHLDVLEKKMSEGGYDVGIAFDGDADRMLAVDENGRRLTGDEIILIIGKYMKENGELKNNTIVATVMSNLGFFIAAKELGINTVQTDVGDRYVLECMLENDYTLGGEESGHIICLSHNSTGDGLLSALRLLEVVKKTGKPLSELRKIVTILPQVLVNAKVKNENKAQLLTNKQIVDEIATLEASLDGKGRVLIRPSGTEPVVRVMLEGSDKDALLKKANALAALIEELLG